MRLKKLEILGFKSFAEKTKLEFHAGITAVVGPNGCGKSNIADAFRWVLGEQSAKSMRGNRMADVIFAGTTDRKQLNFAEVTIVLDGIEGKLPIDYEELAITRRLHRSGESEYFVNRHPARLKDVQALFLDTGMGKDAYSIFEQGKIDQVINLSPLERRYIFEEASGILRFLQRKKEALRKLEQTDLNVSRIKDIHQEVEKQIIILEKQAEQARRFKNDKLELENLEKTVLLAKWDNVQKSLEETRCKTAVINGQIDDATVLIEGLKVQLSEAKLALDSAEKALRARSEEVYQARSTKEITSKERAGNQERLKELLIKENRWQQELQSCVNRHSQRQQERLEIEKAQKEQEYLSQNLETEVNSRREKTAALEAELAEHRRQHYTKQQELLVNLKTENFCESELKQISLRIENAQERHAQIQRRKVGLSLDVQVLSIQQEEKKQRLEEVSKLIDSQKELFAASENTLKDLLEEEGKTQDQSNVLQIEISESKARQKALQRLRDDMEGFSSGGKHLIQEAAKSSCPFYNKIKGLYEYITPKKGAGPAVAAALKAYAQTLVVDAEEDFSKVIAYVKQKNLVDLSILCLETIVNLDPKLLKSQDREGLSPLLQHVLESKLANHFLKDAFLSDSIETALSAVINDSSIEVLTHDGIYIDRHCVLFYATQGANNVFLREAELKALNKKLQDKENDKQQIEIVLKALQQKKNQIQSERIELDKMIRREEMKLVEVNFGLQKTLAELDRTHTEEKALDNEFDVIAKSMEGYTAATAELQSKYANAKNKVLETKKFTESLNEQLDSRTVVLKQEARQLQERTMVYQRAMEENQNRSHALHVLEIKDQESRQQQKRLEDEIEAGRHLRSQIQYKEAEVEKLLHEAEHALSSVAAACSELEQEVSVRKGAIEHLEGKINDRRQMLKKSEAERSHAGIQGAQLESTAQSLENDLLERHHLDITQARAVCQPASKPVENLEKQIRAMRQQIENAGDINMASIEECEKHKERYQFLNQQIDDLNLSKQELIKIIADLDKESRNIFKATFDQICLNFKKNFKILFNGGEADLKFTETADVLEAGIDIIAKPPGKQMRSISLLSGGEKCLTAVALLFAIFEVKPSPFCILDEIDAPLDDTNVERFVNIVREFADRCQFIIITHNKRTMAIADMIFGVSMEEKGVSKLLSMDFSEGVEPVLV